MKKLLVFCIGLVAVFICCAKDASALEREMSEFYASYELVDVYTVELDFEHDTVMRKCLVVSDKCKVMVLITYYEHYATLEVRKRFDSTWKPRLDTDWSSLLFTDFTDVRTFSWYEDKYGNTQVES